MITILFKCIVIRMKKMCCARGCYNSGTHFDLNFFRFPRNPQQ